MMRTSIPFLFCIDVGRRLEHLNSNVCLHLGSYVSWMLIQGYACATLMRFPFSQGLPFVIKIDNIYPVSRFTSQRAQSINSFAYFSLISSWFTPTVEITEIMQDYTKNAGKLSDTGTPKTIMHFCPASVYTVVVVAVCSAPSTSLPLP